MRVQLLLASFLLACMLHACSKKEQELRFGKDMVYYFDPVEEETAQKVGDFLKAYRYFQDNGSVVQLVQDSSLLVRFATRPGIEKDPYIIDGFVDMQLEMSLSVFDGQAIDFQLCDSTMSTKGTITYSDAREWIQGRAYLEPAEGNAPLKE